MAQRSGASDPLIEVASGAARGRSRAGIHTFLNLPYAAPPVGQNWFAKPQPVVRWTGVRDAGKTGPTAPKEDVRIRGIDMAALAGDGWRRGDDYLSLNVWAPEDARRSPVMVWIHGGANADGSKDAPVTDGSGFARSGVVCIAISYRLGTEGFLPIPGVATNLGLRDMIAALQWVRDNVEVFGGDPANVTIFGESAGGMSVCALLASPLTVGLFSRAIVQSGHGSSAYPIHVAGRTSARLAEILKVSNEITGFRSTSHEAILKAQQHEIARPGKPDLRDAHGFDAGFGVQRFGAVFGDDVLPQSPLELVRAGAGRDVDLLIGATAEEANMMFVPTRIDRLLPRFVLRRILSNSMPRGNDLLNAYGATKRGGRRAGEAFTRALTDVGFRWPARQFAEHTKEVRTCSNSTGDHRCSEDG